MSNLDLFEEQIADHFKVEKSLALKKKITTAKECKYPYRANTILKEKVHDWINDWTDY